MTGNMEKRVKNSFTKLRHLSLSRSSIQGHRNFPRVYYKYHATRALEEVWVKISK
jgi:hypothetical protein